MNWMKKESWQHKEKDKHVLPGSFAQRLCSMLMLVPCFSLELEIRHEIPPLSFFVAGSHQLYISDRKDYL